MLRSFVILFCCAVAACGTVSNVQSLDVAFHAKGDGTVILALTSNFPDIGRFDVVTLEGTDEKHANRVFTVNPVKVATRHSTNLFVFQLEPGKYRLKNVATGLPGTTHQYCQISTHGRFDFSVESDKLTDLGRLVVVRTNQNACDFVRDFRETKSEAVVASAWPEYAVRWKRQPGEETLGWSTPPEPSERLKIMLAKRMTPGIYNPIVRETGVLYAGSELGQVLARSPQGHWFNYDTQTSNTLFFVSPVSQKELVLVGELNTFLHLKEGVFSPIDLEGLPTMPLVYAGYHDGVGLLALFQGNNKLLAYRKASVLMGSWQQISVLETGSTFWGFSNASIKTRDNRIYVATTPDKLYVFDVATEKWSEKRLPGTPHGLSVSPDHHLIVLIDDGWKKANFLSVNEGDSWEPLNKQSVSQLAYSAAGNRIVMLSDNAGIPDMMVTRDRGENWEKEKAAKSGTLFVDDGLELIFGGYNQAIAGNEVFSYGGSAYEWQWERTTNFEHHRMRFQRELEQYLERTQSR
jgi:hypothetical protein